MGTVKIFPLTFKILKKNKPNILLSFNHLGKSLTSITPSQLHFKFSRNLRLKAATSLMFPWE